MTDITDDEKKAMTTKPKSKGKTIDLTERLNRQARQTETVTVDPTVPTRMPLTLDQLVPYDKNPRLTRNPKYEEIKDSIRNRGLDDIPNVTRRNSTGPFMIKNGGNTRLAILRELYEETGDKKYFEISCLFKPWVDEVDALAGHLSENDNHGQMLLIERALGAIELKNLLEVETGSTLSQRQAAEKMTSRGWKMDQSNLSVLFYAVESLLPLIPDVLWSGAGNSVVKRIRSLDNSYKAYWESIESISAEPPQANWQMLWNETLKECDDTQLDVEAFRDLLDLRMGDALDVSFNTIRAEVDAILAGGKPSGIKPPNPIYGKNNSAQEIQQSITSQNSTAIDQSTNAQDLEIQTGLHVEPVNDGQSPVSTESGVSNQNNSGALAATTVTPEAKIKPASKPARETPTIQKYQDQAYHAALELMTKLSLDPFIEKTTNGLGFCVLPVHNTQLLRGTHRRYYVYLVNLFVITCTTCPDPAAAQRINSILPFSIDMYLEHVYYEHDPSVSGNAIQMMVSDLFKLQWMRSSPHPIDNKNHSEAILLSLITQLEAAIAGLRHLTDDNIGQLFM